MNPLRAAVTLAIATALLVRISDMRRERQRRLALLPSGVTSADGLTMRRSRQLATLRGMTTTYPTAETEHR